MTKYKHSLLALSLSLSLLTLSRCLIIPRCKDAYGSFVNIHGGHLCAGKLNGEGGTCVGDSGGPLQCRLNKDGPWILVGVTSFGSGCALEGFPDVYTRTSYYMKWIEDTIAAH